jgi:hypothetical protein
LQIITSQGSEIRGNGAVAKSQGKVQSRASSDDFNRIKSNPKTENMNSSIYSEQFSNLDE